MNNEEDTETPTGADIRWRSASAQVRTAAQWMMTTLGAVAGVVFGSGPISAGGKLAGPNLELRVAAIVAAAAVGAVAVAYLIFRISRVLLPHEVRLSELSDELKAKIANNHKGYLPSAATTLDEFRVQLRDWRSAVRSNAAAIRRLESDLERLEEKILEAHTKLGGVDGRVDRLEGSIKAIGDPEARAIQQRRLDATETEKTAQVAKIDRMKRNRDELERNLAIRSIGHAGIEENVAVYEDARLELLAESGYAEVADVLDADRFQLATAVVLAAVAGVAYLMLWSHEPKKPTSQAQPLQLAVVHRTLVGDATWAAAGLAECDPGGTGEVSVIVDSGNGTRESPYVVRTLGTPAACRVVSFTVPAELTLVKPLVITISTAAKQ